MRDVAAGEGQANAVSLLAGVEGKRFSLLGGEQAWSQEVCDWKKSYVAGRSLLDQEQGCKLLVFGKPDAGTVLL